MTSKIWSSVLVGLVVAGAALGYLANEALRQTPQGDPGYWLAITAAVSGGGALLTIFRRLARHFQDIRDHAPHTPPIEHPAMGLIGILPAVLRCLDFPVVVVGNRGGITALNPQAVALLAPHGASGVSIFRVFERDDLTQAFQRARSARTPLMTTLRRCDGGDVLTAKIGDLGFQTGTVMVFDTVAPGLTPVEVFRPGGIWGAPPDPAQALAALPLTALVVERDDMGVHAIHTVRLAGGRVFPTLSLDFAIAGRDDGVPRRPFGEIWPALADALRGTIVVSEDAEATWSALADALRSAGLAVPGPPPLIDVAALAGGTAVAPLAERSVIAGPNPGRDFAKHVAALVAGPDGNGIGTVGDFVRLANHATTGDDATDALQPRSEPAGTAGTDADG